MESLLQRMVSPGEFSDEYAITGDDSSLFAPKECVELDGGEPSRGHPVEGWLRVEVDEPIVGKGNVAVRLPSEAIEAGYYVSVASDRLKAAASGRQTQS
jgi:hypothetical protein